MIPSFDPYLTYRIQIRFNHDHEKDGGLCWRVFVGDAEFKARSISVYTPLFTELVTVDGELKGNVYTVGFPTFDVESNVIVH